MSEINDISDETTIRSVTDSQTEPISELSTMDEATEILNLIDSKIDFNENGELSNVINNNLKYNDIDVDIDKHITEKVENFEEIVFASLKNFYVSEKKCDNKCPPPCPPSYPPQCPPYYPPYCPPPCPPQCPPQCPPKCPYDNDLMEEKRNDVVLLEIDISFNDFSTLFYSNHSHHFNISISNRFNRFLFFNKQFLKTTEDLTERFDLTRTVKKLWAQNNNLAVSSMQPQQSIRLTKECKKILSLYNLKGTTVALSLTDVIDEIIDILKNQETIIKIKCLLHSDIYIQSADIYVRVIWPYSVSFNTGNVEEFGLGEVLDVEDV